MSGETNLWLHNLRNDITEQNVIQKLLLEYRKHNSSNLHFSVMNIITNANKETFMEVTTMSDIIEELFLEAYGEELEMKLAQLNHA